MSNLYSTIQKINLAHNIVQDTYGNKSFSHSNDLLVSTLNKIEKKYIKNKSCDLSDFAICLTELPPQHLKLMRTIGWLNHDTETPQKHLDGFYSEVYSDTPGCTQISHYLTVNAYVYLLLTELEIIDMYR